MKIKNLLFSQLVEIVQTEAGFFKCDFLNKISISKQIHGIIVGLKWCVFFYRSGPWVWFFFVRLFVLPLCGILVEQNNRAHTHGNQEYMLKCQMHNRWSSICCFFFLAFVYGFRVLIIFLFLCFCLWPIDFNCYFTHTIQYKITSFRSSFFQHKCQNSMIKTINFLWDKLLKRTKWDDKQRVAMEKPAKKNVLLKIANFVIGEFLTFHFRLLRFQLYLLVLCNSFFSLGSEFFLIRKKNSNTQSPSICWLFFPSLFTFHWRIFFFIFGR